MRKRQSGLLYLRDKTVLDTAKKEEKKNEETRYNILIKGIYYFSMFNTKLQSTAGLVVKIISILDLKYKRL